jgi:hypothetical protein
LAQPGGPFVVERGQELAAIASPIGVDEELLEASVRATLDSLSISALRSRAKAKGVPSALLQAAVKTEKERDQVTKEEGRRERLEGEAKGKAIVDLIVAASMADLDAKFRKLVSQPNSNSKAGRASGRGGTPALAGDLGPTAEAAACGEGGQQEGALVELEVNDIATTDDDLATEAEIATSTTLNTLPRHAELCTLGAASVVWWGQPADGAGLRLACRFEIDTATLRGGRCPPLPFRLRASFVVPFAPDPAAVDAEDEGAGARLILVTPPPPREAASAALMTVEYVGDGQAWSRLFPGDSCLSVTLAW